MTLYLVFGTVARITDVYQTKNVEERPEGVVDDLLHVILVLNEIQIGLVQLSRGNNQRYGRVDEKLDAKVHVNLTKIIQISDLHFVT